MTVLLASIILALGIGGIGFMLLCLHYRRLTDRNLVIGGSMVLVNFVLLGWLFYRLLAHI
jgi:hypothetical protein